MKMDRMVEYLENRGFNARKLYDTNKKVYEFQICQFDISVMGYFKYPETASKELVDREQRKFLDELISDWQREYSKLKQYIDTDIALTKKIYRNIVNSHYGWYSRLVPEIKDVIWNGPATIVFWADGTKTIVKCCDELDVYDAEKGLAMAICEKAFGNKTEFHKEFKKWVPKAENDIPVDFDGFTFKTSLAESFKTASESLGRMARALKGE